MIIQNVVYIDNIKNFILLLKDMYDTCEKSVYQLQMGTGKTAILTPMILMHYCLYVDITQPNNAVITFVTKQQLLKSWFSIFINKLIHNVCDLNISYNTIKENYDYNWDKKHILIVDDNHFNILILKDYLKITLNKIKNICKINIHTAFDGKEALQLF